jgi:hypothetical protein
MLLTPQVLPSSGIEERSKAIEVRGLNFTELLEYTKSKNSCKNEFDNFILDYSWVKRKISNWQDISLIDLDFVIYTIKRLTVSDNAEFSTEMRCTNCNAINELYLSADQVKMPDPLRYDIRGKIVLSGQDLQFEIPMLDFFDECFSKIARYKNVKDLQVIKLITCFPEFKNNPNRIQNLVANAVVDDIVALSTLEAMYFDSQLTFDYKCSKCGGGHWSIGIRALIDNVFRSLLLSRRSVETKIDVRNVR